ncbi:protein mono-ADP-ribosyltransferase PARP12 [Amia ocellicauda]|uniref:protein mono-ADP-ribosyltransferase PARP12 n=1 Tax=Amia ocellicauda TaxID=2972642 RepID=UPI003464702F
MAASDLTRILCSNNGAMDCGELLANIASDVDTMKSLEKMLEDRGKFAVIRVKGKRRVIARTKLRLCRARGCEDCSHLHLCKFFLYGECKFSRGRRNCRFSHDMNSVHNAKVLRENDLQDLDRRELCQLLLQNEQTLLPPVCFSYNKGNGQYGNCDGQESCTRLHICEKYIRGTCNAGVNCDKSHDFCDGHPLKTLEERGLPRHLINSLLPVYQNILDMKNENYNRKEPQKDKTEICIFYVKKNCMHGDKCNKVHFNMPYKWEIWNGQGWSLLPDNEAIEQDFCNPDNIYSSGFNPVNFDMMTRGSAKVRRLSTFSSVVQPTFILTTEWAWYWEDENGTWIQYAASAGLHSASSITSEDLEKLYLEDDKAVIEFTAGRQAYKLSFQDMIQTNKQYGTKRLVRRRPVFVSTADAQTIRTSQKGSNRRFNQSSNAVPTNWDKSALPETGHKKVNLLKATAEYNKVQSIFEKTMYGFTISKIERIQNKMLWAFFQCQKEQMEKNNRGKGVNEKLLFHGTDAEYVDAICNQNFDWRLCGKHATAYGKGSYFARDAKYSHGYTGSSTTKFMFVSRVLVGQYITGNSSYLRPPSKDGGDVHFYDSCVDDQCNPSIYVVFEKHQVYPEYLIQYHENTAQYTPRPRPVVASVPQATPTYSSYNYRGSSGTSSTSNTSWQKPQPKSDNSCIIS